MRKNASARFNLIKFSVLLNELNITLKLVMSSIFLFLTLKNGTDLSFRKQKLRVLEIKEERFQLYRKFDSIFNSRYAVNDSEGRLRMTRI